LPQHERTNIAVFIDFDNIEIGVKTTLGEHFDIGIILEALKERGEVVTKIAYADWTRAGEYSRALTQHAIRLVQRNLTPGGDKNGADINLALDALEMAFTHPHINAYVIVGGDSDFLSLVEKLKQYDKKVFVVGGRAFTSIILQRNCHEFIAYENLARRPARGGRPTMPVAAAPMTQAFPIVRRALKLLADREVSPQTGLLKSTLLQLDSTFSERSYGASSFLDFVEKLSQAGLVLLKHSGRSVMVELNPGFEDGDAPAESWAGPKPKAAGDGGQPPASNVVQAFRPQTEPPQEAPAQIGDNAEGVRLAAQILAGSTTARWPMYLRNVKQILRAANGFDERRYGFAGLIELLRACQRESLVRLERDRRGGLRVFQGSALAQPVAQPADPAVPSDETPSPASEAESAATVEAAAPLDDESDDFIELPPASLVDTTAELLGRAKHRRPRARTTSAGSADAAGEKSGGRGARKSAAKKAGGRTRRTGTRKPAAAESRAKPTDS
jgi:uncharacterized LabA/DUF88 family protein